MEEVLQKFQDVTVDQFSEPKSNFEDLYKNHGKFSNQEERRQEILDTQKQNRNDSIDKFRGILDLVQNVEDISGYPTKKGYKPSTFVAGFMKDSGTYKNILMLSEWMVEKPFDFNENWLVVPCPKGRRMLVIANRGVTRCYTKYGRFKFENYTALPGGNPFDVKSKGRCCVLDGFFDEKTNTMFVLDLLAWNNLCMTDGETDFRNYWLKIQMSEITELSMLTRKNNMKFSILPKVLCTEDNFNEFMMKYPQFENNHPVLDGLLFYHKNARYFPGETPLVGWLYPFMVKEILGSDITVNDAYMLCKPKDYVNQAEYITNFETNINKNRKKPEKNSKVCVMETAEEIPVSHNKENVPTVSNDMDCNVSDETEAVINNC